MNARKKLLHYWYWLLVLVPLVSTANNFSPITRIGIEKGLSNNSVRCILQDRQGFIWIGTYDGLNRYDGSEFKVFRNRPDDSTSLPHNYIYSIHEDGRQQFWVGTGQGIAQLDRTTGIFSPVYYIQQPGRQRERLSINANFISSDSQGNVWFGTNGWGLMQKRSADKDPVQILCQTNTGWSNGYIAKAMAQVRQQLYVFVTDVGLCQYDAASKRLLLADASVANANSMVADAAGNIWVGSENGLHQYNTMLRKYTAHFTQASGVLPFDNVSSLFIANHELWIATEGGGIAIRNMQQGKVRYLTAGKGQHDLSSDAVYALATDNEGRMWIGTHKGGCNVISSSDGRFVTIANDPFNSNSLIGNFVYSFAESKTDEDIFIGTDGNGLSIWNRRSNRFTNYVHHAGDVSSISHNSVTNIFTDYTGKIWMTTLGGGVNQFSKATGKFKHYKLLNTANGTENKNALSLYEDKDKTLWATTFGKMYRYNRADDRFDIFSQNINDIISITEDKQGQLWGGTTNQLVQIDRQDKQHHFYDIGGKPVRAILADANSNRLWLGTEGNGLLLFDIPTGKVMERYTDANGLCNNAVHTIVKDGKGMLWLSTFNGLARFDPKRKSFSNFYQSDGLQSNQFNYRSAYKLRSGELMFGGIKGFNLFHPDSIVVRSFMPPLYITSIMINSKDVAVAGNDYISKRNAATIEELRIPFDEAILSIRFNALEYASPEKISYAYFLEGWDRGWTYAGNTRNINYNNLTEGSYVLHIKSTNAAGTWQEKETLLRIIVLPPWYRSWWAYSLYLLLAAGMGYVIYNYRIQQERLRYKIKLAQLQADQEQEVNERRQSFFTNIAHEFRTPLTLIINPLKDIVQKEDSSDSKEELGLVYRNARRLLSLVDQFLLFRKTDTDTGQLVEQVFHFDQLCQETYLYFVQQARSKQINYQLQVNAQPIVVKGDREKLDIILYNLMSNALKYTPEQGEVLVNVQADATQVTVEVCDSGPGIPPQVGNRLFEKYYQVKEPGHAGKPGFGIGLYLAKKLAEMHGGSIGFANRSQTGTCFTLSLPIVSSAAQVVENAPVAAATSTALLEEIAAGSEPLVAAKPAITNGLESIVSELRSMLIVDDNDQMRSYLRQVFSKNFTVYDAANGRKGLAIAHEVMPDIIISDVMMEDMTGIDFCKAIKETAALNHIPFILITGSISPELKMKGIEYGADDYISKPFEKDLLVARVQSLLRNQQNLQQYFYNEITHQKNYFSVSGEYKAFLEACIDIVERHLDDDEFNIQVLATEIGMSHSKLYKTIKTISGQSASAFIRFIRLRKAAEMFINSNYNINQTAFYVGIKDIKYFREQFAKTFGMKPSEYIEKYRKTLGKNYRLNDKVSGDRLKE